MPPNQPPKKPLPQRPQAAPQRQGAQNAKPVPQGTRPAPAGARPSAPQNARPAQGAQKAANPQPRVIEGFDPKAFSQNLAKEASEVIPLDLSSSDSKFIVDIMHKFCFLCADALVKDTKFDLNAQQASIITQFIGEWTFHKSIDLIKGGIAPELREGVLQKVAFTVFEIAKQAISKNLPQEQVISAIEIQVKNSFTQAISDLKAKGRISDDIANNALSQSNIDAMAQAELDKDKAMGADLSDAKILKLATLALFIKKLPQDKVKNIISNFNQSEAQVLTQYVRMQNLEDKIDKQITIKCLEEIKDVLPEPKVITMDRVYSKLFKIVKTSDKNKISNIINNERPLIKGFVMSPYTKDDTKIPPRIANVVCKYLEEKLSE